MRQCLVISLLAFAQDAAPQKKPIITGPTNWGKLTVKGKVLSFTGHSAWDGEGTVRDDGKVVVVWTFTSDGKIGPGVYKINDDGTLEGAWGWADNVTIDKNGDIKGIPELGSHPSPDKIYNIPEEP